MIPLLNSFWMWSIFAVVVLVLLVLDLGVLHRNDKPISVKESLRLSAFYVFISCCFGAFVWYELGAEQGNDFFAGYFVEKTLSIDNIFVMSLVFGYFNIPRQLQHRVLFWGIIGVVILRGLLIGIGTEAVEHYAWVLDLFAAFLIYTGVKMFLSKNDEPMDIAGNPILNFFRSRLRITPELHGKRFFVRLPHAGRIALWVTPLFVTLVVIEFADVVFALDSVPAIFGITTDPYIVFTSNIFAILGLRALYFSLSAVLHRFAELRYSLALILVFIGGKVFAVDFLKIPQVPGWASLLVISVLIAGGILFSLHKTAARGEERGTKL